jgi:hypothetical protein
MQLKLAAAAKMLPFALLCALPLAAQSASLWGKVTDATGAVLPGARVTVTNAATNVTAWSGVTDAGGSYTAPAVPVGRYDVTVELQGFKTVAVQGVRLEVDQRARIDATLAPGEVQETITVVGDRAGRLETEDSSVGLVISTAQVKNLPLPSRNVLNLLTLAGGVSSGGAATGINASQLSINGSRTLNSEFMVDGVSVVSGSTGGVGRLPSTEAIREFKVHTASYSAEYGRSAGGFVNLVVDSGTSELHGGVYEYFRHESFNANNFFNKLNNRPRPQDRYNQFGAKLGGPLRVPGLYDGKDRTFFFVNYEGLRRKAPGSPISTIPDQAFRSGDFSASPVAVIDPLTGQPFPGNRIPEGRIDPAARRIMGLLPAPNAEGTADAANGRRINNYVNDQVNTPAQDELTMRVDHSVGGNARLFGRFTYYDLFDPATVIMPGALDAAAGSGNTKGYQASLGWTHVWSPATLTELSFGYLRSDPQIDPPTLGVDVRDTFGIERSAFAAAPRFNITGYRELGLNENTYRRQLDNNFHGTFALTAVRGDHTLKMGAQARFNQFDVFNPGAAFSGIYNFTGEMTSRTRASGNPVNALADFLLGAVKTAEYDLPQPETGRRNYNLAFFIQDDWRVTPRLTVNAGLRYEYESPMWVDSDVHSRFDLQTGRVLVAGKNASRTLDLQGDKVNLGPRLGFAYTVNDKTVVRSAFGVFYGQIFSNLGGIVLYPGFTVKQVFGSLGPGVPQPFRLSQGHPLTAVQDLNDPFLAERNATPANPLSQGLNNQFGAISPLPYSMQWNVGIQRVLPGEVVLDLSYVGSRGVHLPVIRNFNTVGYDAWTEVARVGTTLAAQQARPNPNVNSFVAFVHEGSSVYHSGQVRASRRFSSSFSFQATYTFSKAIDDGSGIFNFSQPTGLDVGQFAGVLPSRLNRGLSAFDRPHIFAAAVQYTTGGPKWLRGIETSLIATARSGLVDTIAQTNLHDQNIMPSLPGASQLQQRPNVTGDPGGYAPGRTQEGTAIRYLLRPGSPGFPFTPSGPFFTGTGANRRLVVPFDGPGNLGRSTVREPGEFNVDLALARRFAFGPRFGLTLRAEAFNVLNRVNLNGPNTSLNVSVDPATGLAVFNSPNFGLITSAKAARFVQLVARVDF